MAAIVLAVVLIVASPAQGALFLTFVPPSGSPGTIVRARTGGEGALSVVAPDRLPLYFVGASVADQVPLTVASPQELTNDDRLVAVGEMVPDGAGNGALDFPVPDLPPGPYEVRAYCPACARYSVGHNLLPVGEFEVTDPQHRYRPSVDLLPLLAGIGVLLVIVAAAIVGRRRGARRAG